MKSILYLFTLIFLLNNTFCTAQSKQVSYGFMFTGKKKQTDKTIEILEVIDGTDSQAKGLKSGDIILEINNKLIANLSNDDIFKEIIAAKQVGTMVLKLLQDNKKVTLKTSEFDDFIYISKNDNDKYYERKDVLNFYNYKGYMQNNLYEGYGELTFTGVSKKHGKDKILKQSGNYSKGKFIKGRTTFDAGEFEGRLDANNKPEGQGIFTLKDYSKWEGEFQNGFLMFGKVITFVTENQLKFQEVKNGELLPAKNEEQELANQVRVIAFKKNLSEIINLSKDNFQSLIIEKNKNSNQYQNFINYKTDISFTDFSEFNLEIYPKGPVKLISVISLTKSDAKSLFQKLKEDLGYFQLTTIGTSMDYKDEISYSGESYKLISKNDTFANIELKIDKAPYDIESTDNSKYNVFLNIYKWK